MNRLIRTELLKQRTVRTYIAGTTVGAAVAGMFTVVVLGAAGKQGNDPLSADSLVQVIGAPAAVITLIALVLGVIGMSGEHRHQTITTTVLAAPRRQDVIAAKLGAHAITGALMSVLSVAITTAIATPWLLSSGIDLGLDGDAVRVAAGLILSTALYGAAGVAVGALIRNQTTAVSVALVWTLAVEGLIGDMLRDNDVVRWFPAAAARALVHAGPGGDGLPVAVATGVFTLYVAALATAGARLTVHRDIT